MSSGAIGLLTIAEAGRRIAARTLSPVELTRAVLSRIGALDPALHAFVTITERRALADARAAERAVRAGKTGRLLGIPIAYKDIYETAGIVTTACSRILADYVPKRNAAVVDRLQAAGVVMLGKLTTHEFAIGGPAFDLPWPPARNPWSPAHFTGGSSSGAGAAVAAGLALGALASDTAGSIRVPAAYCGIAGLKPTAGLVSRRGIIPLAPSFDTAGPMAWTVEDCAILLDAMAGYDPLDPASVAGLRRSYARAISGSVKGMRVGVLRSLFTRDAEVTGEMREMLANVCDVLTGLGCRVEEARLPPLLDYAAVIRALICSEAYALHEANMRARAGDFSRIFRVRVLPGALIRAADYIAAQRMRTDLITATNRQFEKFDVLLNAAAQGVAPLIADIHPEDGFARPYVAGYANVAGLPSIALRGGMSVAGLPLGLELTGPAWGDRTVLLIAHHLERAIGLTDHRPQPTQSLGASIRAPPNIAPLSDHGAQTRWLTSDSPKSAGAVMKA
jgi:aspartyl-tRNA(Asn)/glutamyl-tRNA(Gln) amidotransferase subunit A